MGCEEGVEMSRASIMMSTADGEASNEIFAFSPVTYTAAFNGAVNSDDHLHCSSDGYAEAARDCLLEVLDHHQ